MDKLMLLGHLLVSAYLTGLIWTIQMVHYPLFVYADRNQFVAFEAEHGLRISSVVLLPMLLELGLGLVLLGVRFDGVPSWVAWVSAALIGVIWFSTFFLQVPQHNVLASGFDAQALALLVGTNWIRTIAWTAKTALLGWVVYSIMLRQG